MTLAALTTKPEVSDALEKPEKPIAGGEPSECVLAVQYTTGVGGGKPLVRLKASQ